MFKKFIKKVIEARQASVNRQIALMELNRMTDRELHDIGISRSEIQKVVYDGKTAN